MLCVCILFSVQFVKNLVAVMKKLYLTVCVCLSCGSKRRCGKRYYTVFHCRWQSSRVIKRDFYDKTIGWLIKLKWCDMTIKTIEERFKQLQDKDTELFIFKFEKWIYKVYSDIETVKELFLYRFFIVQIW